jgi:uncharacterized protein (DUF362 family)
MTDEKREQKRLTRRGFMRRGGKLGAGVAIAPFVLNLSACSSEPSKPGTGATTGAPGAAASGGSPAGSSSGNAGTHGAPAGGSSGSGGSAAAGGGGAAGNKQQAPAASNDAGSKGGASTDAGGGGGSPNAIAEGAVLLGLYKGDGMAAMKAAAAKLDFSWLKAGDTVLIKVATNSQYKHPTVTSPNGVRAMVAELKARGAGKVIVADQAGVEHVRLSAAGRYGTTRDMWMMNDMMGVEPEAQAHFFDDEPFDTGYFSATLPDKHHWPRGMFLPAIIKQADHIIYMPRIGSHTLAGLTLSQKSAIGWLRDDSRHDLHNDAESYYEKYTEVSYAKEIRDRFRMVVTVNEAILLHGGPDTGTNYDLNPVIVVASTSMPNHDAVGSSILVTLNNTVSMVSAGTMTYSAASAPSANSFFANGFGVVTGAAGTWTSGSTQTLYTAHPFEQGITKDRAIARGWELSGGKPASIAVVHDGEPVDSALMSGLMTHGEGLYKLS